MKQLIEEICKMRKGHWGLVAPRYRSSLQANFYAELNRVFRGHIHEMDCVDFPASSTEISEMVTAKLHESLELARKSSKKAVCIGLQNFHECGTDAQIEALIATRSIRESTSDIAVITLISGCWNRYRIPELWRTTYSATSPCPDQKCIQTVGPYTLDELQDLLLAKGWMPNQPTELDKISAEALLEVTGGDEFMITEVLDTLRMSYRALRSYHDTISDVFGSDAVLAEVERRLMHINERGKALLRRLLSTERIRIDPKDSDAEDLILAGFIRLERLGDIVMAGWNSVLMERVFRLNGERLLAVAIAMNGVEDLQHSCYAINTHAYRLVLEIETILRNTMVRVLANLNGWRETAKHVKIPGNSAEVHAAEVQHHGRKMIAALYPEIDFSNLPEKNSGINNSNSPEESNRRQPKMVGVVDAALEWRQRCNKECWVRPVEDSLPQFMTTGALMNVFLGKDKCENLMKACFNDREHAKTFFTKFASLRSAVMHNHSLGLSAIEDLLMLRVELLTRLGQRPT